MVGRDAALQGLLNSILPSRVGQNGYAFLVGQDGNIISMPQQGQQDFGVQLTDPNTGTVLLDVPVDQHTPTATQFKQDLAKEQSGLAQLVLQGQSKYLAFAQVSGIPWDVVVVRPVSEVLSSGSGYPSKHDPFVTSAVPNAYFHGF